MGTKAGEMRETLIEAMADLKSGKIDAPQAVAMAKLASSVTASLQAEINAIKELRALGWKGTIDAGELSLGEGHVLRSIK